MREKNRIAQDKNRVVFVEVADSSFSHRRLYIRTTYLGLVRENKSII